MPRKSATKTSEMEDEEYEQMFEEGREEEVVEYELEDISGIGRITADKLRRAGYYSLRDIAFASAHELAEVLGSEDRAKSVIVEAQRLLGRGRYFMTAREYYEERKRISYISTGVKALDELLEGGVETRAITELIGEFGAGKTQLCHQLAVMVQLPEEEGGLGSKAVYLDTEGTFRPERIVQMAKFRGLEPEEALEGIIYARAYGVEHQVALVKEARALVEEGARLLILDTLIGNFRAEYAGEEGIGERQRRLAEHLRDLQAIAEDLNAAVVVTNHVLSRPGILGNPLRPAGGNVVSHAIAHRVWLRKLGGGRWAARIGPSCCSPASPTPALICISWSTWCARARRGATCSSRPIRCSCPPRRGSAPRSARIPTPSATTGWAT